LWLDAKSRRDIRTASLKKEAIAAKEFDHFAPVSLIEASAIPKSGE
jgi:hypothetical protein